MSPRANNRIRCQCWFIPALAVLLALSSDADGQGIVYGQFPTTGGTTFPYDANGERLWAPDPSQPQTANLVINGQVAYTFYSGTAFSIQSSSLNAVIASQPYLPNDPTSEAIPLSVGQQIGPDAAGNGWVPNILGGAVLTASRDSGTIGQGPLTDGYFTGIESAYIGLQFQQNGQTYYGWVRAGAPVVGINGGWIYDYAYETTPDTPILAGEVPEPSPLALLTIGLPLLFYRRKIMP